jgi:TonB-dependent SusC/RagA subfamily outer membrane receptor
VQESDRGGFGVFFAFVKDNRFYATNYVVSVPWTNKQLNISYESFRDKTAPGSEEKWKVKLAGSKNEKVAAEILTTMYDASLDQFKPQNWSAPNIWPNYYNSNFWTVNQSFGAEAALVKSRVEDYNFNPKIYDELLSVLNPGRIRELYRSRQVLFASPALQGNVAGLQGDGRYNEVVVMGYSTAKKADLTGSISLRGASSIGPSNNALYVVDGVIYQGSVNDLNPAEIQQVQVLKGDEATKLYGEKGANGVVIITTKSGAGKKEEAPVQIRKNFNETAFFFPELRTDTAGNVEFSFTMPEALTQWKWMMLAHTKDLAFGYSEKNVVTQKDLMLQPNLPRFLREGDLMELSTKIVNLADSEVTGQVQLLLIDPTTNQSVDGWFQNMYSNQYFTVPAKGSVSAQFSIQIPHQYNKPVIIRLVARAGNVSDGEENELPVLTNKILVTETLPLNMRGSATKEFKFEKLLASDKSETLQQHALTVEFTSNPSWYAVQALPYLMEFPYECAEQTWNRFYANALGTKIVNSAPKVKAIFEKWKTQDTAAFLSNLQKNEELKSVLLQETPWLMEASNESERKKRLALLFDLNKMSSELNKNLDQVIQSQLENGGFVWFKGGPDDRYITQYIISGIGHLKTLDAIPTDLKNKIDGVLKSGIAYLDNRIKDDYDELVKSKADLNKQQIGSTQIQYLYMRSFFNDQAVAGKSFQAYNYYRKQAQQFWLQQSRYMQGMIALALFRTGDGKTSFDILRSLKQNAIVNEEMGMYWKEIRSGYYWYQAPIETQSLLIEAFATIYKDNKITDDLKTWLLKNKQTNNWRTSKATADACYALLIQGTDWLRNTPVVQIKLGDKTVSSTEQAEAGTGYFKKTFDGESVNSSMGNISVSVHQPTNNSTNPASAGATAGAATTWGAVYWQYFENAENITSAATPLSIVKKLFVEKNTDRGAVLEPVADNATFKVGDKVKVRIELRVDRNMEYVHMKDMRAASFEPVDVISEYKWQGGLGYYQSTKDASTNFFFNYLPKGIYVFEYSLFASQVGTFSNGITTIQCMYAPEFSSHSEGVKVVVEAK